MKRMTQRCALEVLIRQAARNIAGTWCGIRPDVNTEAELVKEAIAVMWPRAFTWEIGFNDWRNLGISPPREP